MLRSRLDGVRPKTTPADEASQASRLQTYPSSPCPYRVPAPYRRSRAGGNLRTPVCP